MLDNTLPSPTMSALTQPLPPSLTICTTESKAPTITLHYPNSKQLILYHYGPTEIEMSRRHRGRLSNMYWAVLSQSDIRLIKKVRIQLI